MTCREYWCNSSYFTIAIFRFVINWSDWTQQPVCNLLEFGIKKNWNFIVKHLNDFKGKESEVQDIILSESLWSIFFLLLSLLPIVFNCSLTCFLWSSCSYRGQEPDPDGPQRSRRPLCQTENSTRRIREVQTENKNCQSQPQPNLEREFQIVSPPIYARIGHSNIRTLISWIK